MNKNTQSAYPVTMYNADEQKVVAIFKSIASASQYVFQRTSFIGGNAVHDMKRWKAYKNHPYPFCITFRAAKKEQIEKLGCRDYIILDKRFVIDISERSINRNNLPFLPNPPVFNTGITARNLAIMEMAESGYSITEIASAIKVSKVVLSAMFHDTSIPHLLLSDCALDIEGLRSKIKLLENRITLYEQEKIK